MKTVWIKLSLIALIFSALVACGDNMGQADSSLAEVKTLVEPVDGKAIELEPAATASVYFE
jgi:hypothetical protein